MTVTVAHELNDADELIIDHLQAGRNLPQNIANDLGYSRQYIQNRLQMLRAADYVQNIGGGLYELVHDPRSGDVELPEDLHEIGFVEEFKIFDDAEDVKTVRFIGTRGTADIQITDQTMVEFAAIAKEVFTRIHGDMDLLRELLDEYDG